MIESTAVATKLFTVDGETVPWAPCENSELNIVETARSIPGYAGVTGRGTAKQVVRILPDGQALTKAREIADRIARNGPLAVKAIVATLRETETLPVEEAFAVEMGHGSAVMMSDDAREGPRAFFEKREPNFTGT